MYEEQDDKSYIRLILGHIIAYGGMGSTTPTQLENIMKLPLIDYKVIELPISNDKEALEILNELLNG